MAETTTGHRPSWALGVLTRTLEGVRAPLRADATGPDPRVALQMPTLPPPVGRAPPTATRVAVATVEAAAA